MMSVDNNGPGVTGCLLFMDQFTIIRLKTTILTECVMKQATGNKDHSFLFVMAILLYFISVFPGCQRPDGTEFRWGPDIERTWIGPDFWANRLQDWQVSNGRLECRVSAYDRYVSLLTRDLGEISGTLNMRIHLGRLSQDQIVNPDAWAGFRIGARGQFNEYRDTAVRGKGLDAGITLSGNLVLKIGGETIQEKVGENLKEILVEGLELRLRVKPTGENYLIVLSAHHPSGGKLLLQIEDSERTAAELSGGLGLVADFPRQKGGGQTDNTPSFWFSNWNLSGTKIQNHPDRAFGPILFAQHTINYRDLKLTAQLPPMGKSESKTVTMEIRNPAGEWIQIAREQFHPQAYTATFKVAEWEIDRDIPYRLKYKLNTGGGESSDGFWYGTIRRIPVNSEEVKVAAFTGNNDLGFPNTDVIGSVQAHNPDFLFFSGDQIYEGVGGRGVQREPYEQGFLDYLNKWFIWGWAYMDLIRERPSVAIPDDHDVFHGNLWGAGGKACGKEGTGSDQQDTGGYKMPGWWVNLVQRTQTSHLPDPPDPTPVLQDIDVYFTTINYGGISFAVIEDRKFKSAPKALLPRAKIWNGWPQNPEFNVETEADVPGAVLLGERQLEFLEEWANNWSGGIWMKVLLSQTIFANVATLPDEAMSDQVVPKLRILPRDAYAENDQLATDLDSNGWPQTGRNRALQAIRRGFAFHIAGDQHLGSTIQYGVEDWNDSAFALCVPSVSNVWPRRWYPPQPGNNRIQGSAKYSGEFKDGFGNKITVHAVSNPTFTGKKPANLYDRATGFGLVRFQRPTRNIIIECWPRLGDPSVPENKQYPGWPVRINQLDNYGRKAAAYLPTLIVNGEEEPVVQVINESNGEIVYTLRVRSTATSFTPKVFENGTYTIRVGEPGTEKLKEIKGIPSGLERGAREIEINFQKLN